MSKSLVAYPTSGYAVCDGFVMPNGIEASVFTRHGAFYSLDLHRDRLFVFYHRNGVIYFGTEKDRDLYAYYHHVESVTWYISHWRIP